MRLSDVKVYAQAAVASSPQQGSGPQQRLHKRSDAALRVAQPVEAMTQTHTAPAGAEVPNITNDEYDRQTRVFQ